MRRTLEALVKGSLRSRWGLAAALAVVILAIVVLARIFADPDESTSVVGTDTSTPRPAVSTQADGDDGVGTPPPLPTPRTSPGTAQPEAVAYAFASAWVDHRGVTAAQWYDRLLPHATQSLAGRLAGVDPAGVPADRIVGRPTVVPQAAELVEAVLTVDSGRLRLRLVAPDGKWLVDGVDWERP